MMGEKQQSPVKAYGYTRVHENYSFRSRGFEKKGKRVRTFSLYSSLLPEAQ